MTAGRDSRRFNSQQLTTNLDDILDVFSNITTAGFTESETISDYLNTREANGFNWASLDSGNGIHTITVKGEFTKTATNGTASAIIGNRTLVVDPTKVQNQTTP